VSNGNGTISGTDVTNVTVTCTANPYTVTASVAGLAGGQSLVLKLNGAGAIAVNADGSFTFGTTVSSGSSYAVTLSPPPAGQPCTITNGSGMMAAANVNNVQVNCGATAYNLGVSLTGLPFGASITLHNGTDDLPLTHNGSAVFATPVAYNASYAVSITVAPPNQHCAIAGGSGSGTMKGSVTIAVDCPHFAYVTTQLDHSVSIYALNNTTGALTRQTGISPFVTATVDPYGIAISPNHEYVYVPSQGNAGVFGYGSDPATAALSTINGGAAFATGNNPWSIAFNPAGTVAFVTNFGSNSVSSYVADPATGLLTPASVASAPVGINPFGVVVAPLANFVYVANSNSPSVSVFAFDGTATLTEIAGSPFPIGNVDPVMAIDPTGQFAYVLGSTQAFLYAFTIDSTGALTAVPGGPVTTATNNPSGVAVHPNGKFVYVANFASPSGSVSAYAINPATGALTQVGSPVPAGDGAESVTIDPTGQFAYVANQQSDDISAYAIDGTNGTLTPLPTAPSVASGSKPEIIVFR
jgi:DNA-binding beta-propeller fold protein YncE